jgi:type IV pilus assembly protein PilY1
MNKYMRTYLARILAAAVLTAMPLYQANAAPGNLPPAPLFLSTLVESNVYFTLDDSGSMDWGPILRSDTGLGTSSGLPIINGRFRAYYTPSFSQLYTNTDGVYVLPPSNGSNSVWDRAWVVRNHLANPNYFNPSVTYKPWPGTNADGTPIYADANPSKALKHPNQPLGESVNLTINHNFTEDTATVANFWIPTYHVWIDSDNDGVLEVTDANTRIEIAPNTAEMQNFANWFQYYRSRMHATKAIVGDTINNTDASRMGASWFNAGHVRDVATMSDAANKRNLQTTLYNLQNQIVGSPTRNALKAAGNYFMNATGSGPILSAAEGGECQQNFNIVMSDGFWNGNNPAVGNTDVDGGGNDTAFDGNATQSNDGGNYADSASNTLADVAMRNYETDLRTDLANRVPKQATIDEADHQHLVTYSVGFGIDGTLDPATTDPLAAGFSWPTPSPNSNTTVDDLWHASYNGRGTYLSAQNPIELQQALSAAITDISQRTGTTAAVALNTARLSTEAVVYLAQFNSNRWQGNLLAYPIADLDTGTLQTTPKWDAASRLNGRNLASKPRTIISYSDAPAVRDGVPFQWADISIGMRDDLKTNALGGVDTDSVGRARLDYLRGDRSNEGTGFFFRERLSLLGDIVNSGPVFVGEPTINWPDVAPFPEGIDAYSKFKNGAAKDRKKMVYVGANDGMLHAFDDATGDELLAYVPGIFNSTAIGQGLHYLTEPNYVHRFYVDQTPAVSDAFISTGGTTQWRTVLVDGLRSGGRGLFALDVTEPSLFNSETNADRIVMWEFTNDDDIDLGYTFSRPFIGLANNGKWVAIFGNGYNDLGSGEASLYIVDLEGGVDGNWTVGDYWKIPTGVGDTTNRNGLATPALADIDGNGTVDRVYAGDLQGNMWVFDISAGNPSQWGFAYGSNATPRPLFSTPAGQPITAKPVLAKHPTQPDSTSPSNSPNLMVFFGTGQYLVDSDKTSTGTQSYYGVWDEGTGDLTTANLVEQTFDSSFAVKVLSRNPINYASQFGWYFNLAETGERSVTASIARADTVFFNSFVPVEDPCSIGGFGFKYAVDMATGGSPLEPSFDTNGDGVINEFDLVSNGLTESTLVAVRQEGYLPEPVFIEDIAFTADDPTKIKALRNIPVGRFAWQELLK